MPIVPRNHIDATLEVKKTWFKSLSFIEDFPDIKLSDNEISQFFDEAFLDIWPQRRFEKLNEIIERRQK